MKRLTIILAGLITTSGCASFSTVQTERRYSDTGRLENEIVTRASSRTFFDSKSSLATFKATQSEKTQSASVGSLNQEASATNVVNIVDAVVGAAVSSAIKAAK